MLHVREFNTADALMAHYKDLKARQSRPKKAIAVLSPAHLARMIYLQPIGPVMPFSVKQARERNAIERKGSTKTLARTIILEVCDEYGVTWNEVMSPRRDAFIVRARRKIYWKIKTETIWSFPQIGRFVNRDHTTVLHGVRRYELDALHLEMGYPQPSAKEFQLYEKSGCRKLGYILARGRGK